VGATVQRTHLPELSAHLAQLLRGRSINAVLAWDEIAGVDEAKLRENGVQLMRTAQPDLQAGITGCTCAIAETGTLLLTTSRGKALSASLLPEIHVAIVHRSQILWSLEEALRDSQVRTSAASVLITGPSRTADIEMTLTIGVHGPKELLVYIVE
jgi:L-lactate dehydrogenase complex protein LldG